MLLGKMTEVAVASRIPTDYLNGPAVVVGSLQLLDKALAVGVAAPVASKKDKGSRLIHIENAIGHGKLDDLIDSHFCTRSLSPLQLLDFNAEVFEPFPERVT